jgi:amino acid adenylation domain-containing protein
MANISRLENLPPEKRALLNRLLQQRSGATDRIERRPAGMLMVPASFGQTRIWFLDRLEPGLPVYQISTALLEHGAIDAELLRQSINIVISRHESLRNTFTEIDGEVFQIIAPYSEIDVHVADYSWMPAPEAYSEAFAFASAETAAPFSLESGPLLRLNLIRLDNENSVVLLTMHHIITDGWSMKVLLQELSTVYSALCRGQTPRLPELPIQYADYALWQRQHLTSAFLRGQVAYWRQQLEGASRLQLPSDYPNVKRTSRGARELFSLGWTRTRNLEAISTQSGSTMFMTLLAVFQILLGRYSGQDDIVVGTPVAGRLRPETEGLIGFLLNTICMRTSLAGNPSFFELLEQVRQTAVNAYAHQDVPFEKVVEGLAPDRRLSDSALFNVMFVLQPHDGLRTLRPTNSSPSEKTNWQLESGTAKFDLTLSLAETEGGLVGALEYSTDLFKPFTARRMRDHFLTLIDSISAGLHTPISNLQMLTPAEEQKILHEWNDAAAPFREDTRLERLIIEQAATSPDSTALICEGEEISYRELGGQSLRMARYLESQGVRCHDRVGIFLGRGRQLLPAILGTWAAGGVYVPMDTQSPPDRIGFILEDARLACILTEQHLVSRIPPGNQPRLCLDQVEQEVSRASADPLTVNCAAADPAYIIYTSGSTGKPKGVVVSHRSALNYLTWVNRVLIQNSSRLMPAITEITFDASLKQLFAPLLRGDPVWLLHYQTLEDLQQFAHILGTRGDFTLNCVPWLWSRLLDTLSSREFSARKKLKRLLVGGEELGADLLERTFAVFPLLEVWNLYGPTEATANATACRLSPGQPVSIGTPIANCVVRVLDSQSRLVPVGVSGELHIGGAGVALGYWDRPELTQKLFIADPFNTDPAARLYKTGDRVSYREDGSLTYGGRIDRQIKLHGYRIEPGEIEAVLRTHPVVTDLCVVQAQVNGEQQLVAYIEAHRGVEASLSELRKFAARNLPAYMVPSKLVRVKELPRGLHGKIDGAALLNLSSEEDANVEAAVSPRDEYEQGIASVWEAVLSIDSVGVRSNFFSLGGHSLLAMQVISRIRQKFAVDLPLRAIFEAPTVEELSRRLRDSQERAVTGRFAAIPRISR